MSSTDIDAMIAELKTKNYTHLPPKKDDSQSLKQVCEETFEKTARELENSQHKLAAATERLKQLKQDQQDLMEMIETKKLDETLNASLMEECKRVDGVLKV
uniref:SKA2 domain-containing protein n=1 Tax=Caenorhabditis tropicalis TaxID=1561998 RepID=A0A1I7UXE5_9PELO